MMNQTPLHILLVEDQMDLAGNITSYLEQQGLTMDYAQTGPQGLSLALEEHFDLIILDLMLPGMDGLEVAQQIRQRADRHIPILMLTARDTLDDKLKGFEQGADDYLTKPFDLEELHVRCLALARRPQMNTQNVLEIGDFKLDRQRKSAERQGQTVKLNSMGYRILEILAEAHPKVVTRSELRQKLWGDEPTESDALRSHIYHLRQAVDKPFKTPLIKTVHGVGFCLEAD